jgi:hypothetical protein
VSYAWSDVALDAIASLPDARVLLCFREPAARMVSAYRLFRALYGLESYETTRHPVASQLFGTQSGRLRLAKDPLAPHYFRHPIAFRRFHTLLRYSEVGAAAFGPREQEECEREFDRLERQRLPARVIYEWARWKKESRLPLPSIVANSYFASAMRRVLDRIDADRIMVVTLSDRACADRMGVAIPRFLGEPPVSAAGPAHAQRRLGFRRSGAGHRDGEPTGDEGLRRRHRGADRVGR